MSLQPLLLDRPLPAQIFLAVFLPAAFGLLTGFVLGASAGGYLVLSVLGIAGGLVAGFDHDGAQEGFLRGICGGLLFGVFILVAHSISGVRAKTDLPHPHLVLVVITVVLGAILGAIGGAMRARTQARRAAAGT